MVLNEATAAAPRSGGQKVPVTLNHESKKKKKKSNVTLRHQENDGQASVRLRKNPSFLLVLYHYDTSSHGSSQACTKIRDSFFFYDGQSSCGFLGFFFFLSDAPRLATITDMQNVACCRLFLYKRVHLLLFHR